MQCHIFMLRPIKITSLQCARRAAQLKEWRTQFSMHFFPLYWSECFHANNESNCVLYYIELRTNEITWRAYHVPSPNRNFSLAQLEPSIFSKQTEECYLYSKHPSECGIKWSFIAYKMKRYTDNKRYAWAVGSRQSSESVQMIYAENRFSHLIHLTNRIEWS